MSDESFSAVCTLVTGRTLEQAKGMHIGKTEEEYRKAVDKAFLSPEVLSKLSLNEGDEVTLKTRCGKVRVRVYADAGLPEDVVFVPMGPTANALVGSNTEGSGMPSFKGLQVEVVRS